MILILGFYLFFITKILFLLEQKFRLKSDFQKELAELRRKYEVKFQEIEVEFQQTKKTLDTNLNSVWILKYLVHPECSMVCLFFIDI